MSTHLLRLHIERPGTPLYNEQGGFSLSLTGHAWFEVISDGGKAMSAGFGPENAKSGMLAVPGKGSTTDGHIYAGLSAFTATYAITADQALTLDNFARYPLQFGFELNRYHALENSCVDFVWKGLQIIGMNPEKYEGKFVPMDNIHAFSKLKNPYSPFSGPIHLQHFTPPFWNLMPTLVSDFSGDGLRIRTPEERFWEGDTSMDLPEGTITIGPLGGVASFRRPPGAGFHMSFRPDSLWWDADLDTSSITVGPLGAP